MKHHSYFKSSIALLFTLLLCLSSIQHIHAATLTSSMPLVVLSDYHATLNIGNEFILWACSSDGAIPVYKSSNRSIASVNTYGLVTAKKNGTCRITAKVSGGEASCTVKVTKTQITLNSKNVSLENGNTYQLTATTSNGSMPLFSSNKKSVAVVDENGLITASKPGEAIITVKADKSSVQCKVKVKKPSIHLSNLVVNLYRDQRVQLTADISSSTEPVWKSNRTKVATVSDTGMVVARKHGTALVTVKADGSSKICEVNVLSPEITLSSDYIKMKKGKKKTLDYTISSGNAPLFKSSNTGIIKVDQLGNITALKKGKAVITVTEDGTKEKCIVIVTA